MRPFRKIVPWLAFVSSLIPLIAFCWGNLADIQYKIKSQDGNRWSSFLARGKIVKGFERKGGITFTFDDGPDHRTTPILLNALDKYGIKATFFVNGHRFHKRTAGGEENKSILREIYRRGHFLGNHTFSHKDITQLDQSSWRNEIKQVELGIQSVTGRRPWLFRPPFGRVNSPSLGTLSSEGYTVVMWNLDPLDWKAKTALDLLERTKKVIQENPEGGIMVMHDTNRTTVEGFSLIVEWLLERNAKLRSAGKPILEIVGMDAFVRGGRKVR